MKWENLKEQYNAQMAEKKKKNILAQDMWVRDYLLLLLPENYSTSVTV